MRILDYNELVLIEGGSKATDVADGFCAVVGLAGIFGFIGGPVAWTAEAGCAIYALARLN